METLGSPNDRCSTMQLAGKSLREVPVQLMPPNIYSSVIFLNLSENSIQNIPKQFFAAFPSLATLDLRNNKLTTLHCDISLLKSLRILHIGYNLLTSLPFSIGALERLEVLSAPNNRITSLPSSISNLGNTLTTLIIEQNMLKVLPDELSQIQTLTMLNLYHNQFVSLPSSLWKLRQIKEFSLEWFRYASPPLPTTLKGPEGMRVFGILQELCKEIWNNKSRELSVMAFLQCFSEEDCSTLVKKKYIVHMAAGADDLSVLEGVAICEPSVVNLIDAEGRSALCLALLRGHVEAAKLLLSRGALVTKGFGNYGSLLHLAVNTLCMELVKALIERGANPSSQDIKGNTPLHNLFLSFNAKPHTREAIAKQLLYAGANPNVRNNERWCPVHIAVKQDKPDAIQTIIKINSALRSKKLDTFDLNLPGGEDRWTPLHVAAFAGCFETVSILLENGANPLARCTSSRTPRQYARGHLAVYKLLYRAELRLAKSTLLEGKKQAAECECSSSPSGKKGLMLKKATVFPQKYNPAHSLFMAQQMDSSESPGLSIDTPRTCTGSPLKDRRASCFTVRKQPNDGAMVETGASLYFSRSPTLRDLQRTVYSHMSHGYERYFALELIVRHLATNVKRPSKVLEEAIERCGKLGGSAGNAYMNDLIHAASLFPDGDLVRLLAEIYQEAHCSKACVRYEINYAIQTVAATPAKDSSAGDKKL